MDFILYADHQKQQQEMHFILQPLEKDYLSKWHLNARHLVLAVTFHYLSSTRTRTYLVQSVVRQKSGARCK